MHRNGIDRTLNVSEGGLLLETDYYIRSENRLNMEVALEDTLINLRGRVGYCNESEGKKFNTGVELQDPGAAERVILCKFIEIFAERRRDHVS